MSHLLSRIYASFVPAVLTVAIAAGHAPSAPAQTQPDQKTRTIRVGIARMTNLTAQGVDERWERDQLVRNLQQIKPTRKYPSLIEAVPLDSSSAEDAPEEAAGKKCQFVVLTSLVDVRHASKTLAGSNSGSINGPISGSMGRAQSSPGTLPGRGDSDRNDPDGSITLNYKIIELTNLRTIAEGTTEVPIQDNNENRSVDDAMRLTSSKVASQLRKDHGVKID